MSETLRACKQCGHDKPESDYYKPRKPSYRVTICNDCAHANMTAWARRSVVDLSMAQKARAVTQQ